MTTPLPTIMAARNLLLLVCLLPFASALVVQPKALQLHAVRPAMARPMPMPFMQESTPEGTEATPAPTETPPPPPAEPEEPAFDITNYSITISLAVIFIIAKGLAALGIIGDN